MSGFSINDQEPPDFYRNLHLPTAIHEGRLIDTSTGRTYLPSAAQLGLPPTDSAPSARASHVRTLAFQRALQDPSTTGIMRNYRLAPSGTQVYASIGGVQMDFITMATPRLPGERRAPEHTVFVRPGDPASMSHQGGTNGYTQLSSPDPSRGQYVYAPVGDRGSWAALRGSALTYADLVQTHRRGHDYTRFRAPVEQPLDLTGAHSITIRIPGEGDEEPTTMDFNLNDLLNRRGALSPDQRTFLSTHQIGLEMNRFFRRGPSINFFGPNRGGLGEIQIFGPPPAGDEEAVPLRTYNF